MDDIVKQLATIEADVRELYEVAGRINAVTQQNMNSISTRVSAVRGVVNDAVARLREVDALLSSKVDAPVVQSPTQAHVLGNDEQPVHVYANGAFLNGFSGDTVFSTGSAEGKWSAYHFGIGNAQGPEWSDGTPLSKNMEWAAGFGNDINVYVFTAFNISNGTLKR